MNILRKGFVTLTVSGLLLGGAGFTLAQQDAPAQTGDILAQGRGHGPRSASQKGHGFQGKGARGMSLGRFSLGTTVELNFYNGDPENGGTLQNTLSHVVGEDSEVVFREALEAARADATHMTMDISEQTRTLDLNAMRERSEARGGGERRGTDGLGRLSAGLNRLNAGSTVSATFYDSDPEAGGNLLQTLRFAYGVDSARGFMDDVMTAAEDAAFVTVTTSPQERTLELSSMEARGGQGRRGFEPGRTR